MGAKESCLKVATACGKWISALLRGRPKIKLHVLRAANSGKCHAACGLIAPDYSYITEECRRGADTRICTAYKFIIIIATHIQVARSTGRSRVLQKRVTRAISAARFSSRESRSANRALRVLLYVRAPPCPPPPQPFSLTARGAAGAFPCVPGKAAFRANFLHT
jgi:hypothetical protein